LRNETYQDNISFVTKLKVETTKKTQMTASVTLQAGAA
jgi:hypothetical protein